MHVLMGGADQFKSELVELLPRLYRYAMVLTGSKEDADDLVQATCERALQRRDQFREGTELSRWTFTIMNSIRRNHLRATGVRQGHGQVEASEILQAADDSLPEHIQDMRLVRQQVMELPVAQRQTMILVYVEGFSYEETATILDIPTGTVMSRLARARAQLASYFSAPAAASGLSVGRQPGNA